MSANSASVGLFLSHKRTCRVAIDAVSFFVASGGNQEGGGKRGDVEGFSRASRKRMMQMLHSVKFKSAVMITLTYPAVYPEDWRKWKANLKEWRRRTEKHYGALRAIWRIELQKRGAPHFHILYLDLPFIPVKDLQFLWYEILHTPEEQRFGNALDLKPIRTKEAHGKVMAYVSKYVGKLENYDGWEEKPKIGRIWGKWNLEEEPRVECELTEREAIAVAEKVRSMWAANYYTPDDLSRCTLFGEELGTGEFMDTVKSIIIAETERQRGRFGKKVTFNTVKT